MKFPTRFYPSRAGEPPPFNFQLAQGHRPKNPVFLYALGRAHNLNGKFDAAEYEKAIDNFKQAIEAKTEFHMGPEVEPRDFDILSNLGFALSKRGLFKDAIPVLSKAIYLNSDDPYTHYYLGNAYSGTGKYTYAIDSYKKALLFKPHDPDILNDLGLAFYNNDEFQKAIDCYHSALKVKPKDADIHTNLALALYAFAQSTNEQPNEAIEVLEQALSYKQNDPKITEYLAQIRNEVQESDERVRAGESEPAT